MFSHQTATGSLFIQFEHQDRNCADAADAFLRFRFLARGASLLLAAEDRTFPQTALGKRGFAADGMA
jgi:hypothetical protein